MLARWIAAAVAALTVQLVPAQAEEPTEPQFSLVAVRAAVSIQSGVQRDCGELLCADTVSFGGFNHATTLAGPDMGAAFGASIVVHGDLRGDPMLVVVERTGERAWTVRAWGRWNPESRLACIDLRELDRLGFRPQGLALVERDGGLCTALEPLPQETVEAEGVETVSAEAIQQPTVAIVEFERPARFIGFPRRCPGSAEDDDPEQEICVGELYQERAVVVRHISGPRVARQILLRTTTHSFNLLLRPDNPVLAAMLPFEDQGTVGQFAYYWQPPDDSGAICLSEREMGDLNAERAFRTAARRREENPTTHEVTVSRCLRTR